MKEIDHLVETEDLLRDCIYESVEVDCADLEDYDGVSIDIDLFIKEFQSRSKKVKLQALKDLIGAEPREEFEEMIHELYKYGTR